MRSEHDGVVLAYDDTGPGGAAVVMLHGLGSARSTWEPIAKRLAGNARTIAPDLRGHGDSSHAEGTYTLAHYVPDAISLCERVSSAPVVLVGHSLGGVVATSVAQSRPELVRALLLEDPPLYRAEASGAEFNPFLAVFSMLYDVLNRMRTSSAPFEEYLELVERAPSPNGAGSFSDVLGPEGTSARARGLADLDPAVFLAALDGSGLAGADPAAAIECPVRVLRADPSRGPAFSAADEARFLRAHPGARVDVVEGASHFIHDEKPDLFVRWLLELIH